MRIINNKLAAIYYNGVTSYALDSMHWLFPEYDDSIAYSQPLANLRKQKANDFSV